MYLAQQTSLQLGRICNALYTCIHKFNCYVEFSLVLQTSLQLRQFVIAYATVYTSLIVTLYFAQQTSLQLGRFAMLYTTMYLQV